MSQLKVKLVKDHKAECIYRNSKHDPNWFLPTFCGGTYSAETVYLDAIGRKSRNGHKRWAKAICNDCDCDGVALVRVDTIEDAIREALSRP